MKGKDNGTYDIDYIEMFDLLFNAELSSTESRKRFYGLKMLVNVIENEGIENIDENEILDKIKQEKLELLKEKVKFQDQRREYMKVVRDSARFEHILEHIEKTAKEIANSKTIEWTPPVYKANVDTEGVLLISDWHFGMETENFLNIFDKDVFLDRIKKLVQRTIEYGEKENINVLHVANLGDLISGIIHVTIRIMNNEDIITQTQYVSEIIAEMLIEFSKHFNIVQYYDVIDNHSRVTPNKKESIPKESFSRFIPWYLKPRLIKYPTIQIMDNEYDEGISVFKVCGNQIFTVHGHLDSVKSSVSDLSLMLKMFPDYVFMGHYHHNIEDEIHSCEVIVNSSLSGTDQYAKDKRLTAKPMQKFIVFNKNNDRCTYNINLK